MKYLKIQNAGVLDIRLVALMGGTTKANSPYKIGQFGTGLKYTLAYLFRNNIDFKIFAGEEQINVCIETELIEEIEFNIICINGKRTSITTQMGAEWEAWMIIRELWCNALDEGGQVRESTEEVVGQPGTTTFYIQVTSEIREVMLNWEKYFIHNMEPYFENENFAIYPGGEALRIYKNGVLVRESRVPALFSYDIKGAHLNELRQYQGMAGSDIFNALAGANEKVVALYLENVRDDHFEGTMDYDWYRTWEGAWKEVIGEAKVIHPEAVAAIQARGVEFDTAGMLVLPKAVYKHLTKTFEGIGALRVANKVNEFFEVVDAQLESKTLEAVEILNACGYALHPSLKFVFGVFGSTNVLAKVNLNTAEIMISEQLKSSSMFDVVSTLIEENEHYKTGLEDCSRPFQQHFIDLYTKSLLDLNDIKL